MFKNARDIAALTIAGVALVACVALSAALWWQGLEVTAISEANETMARNEAVLVSQVEQAKYSAKVSAAHAKRASAVGAKHAKTIEKIKNIKLEGCLGENLDPDIAALFDGG